MSKMAANFRQNLMRFAPTFYRVEIKFWNTQNRRKTANSLSPILKNWVNLGQKWPRSEKSRRILRRLQMGGVLRCEADQNISIRECFDSLLVSIKSCFGTDSGYFSFLQRQVLWPHIWTEYVCYSFHFPCITNVDSDISSQIQVFEFLRNGKHDATK